MRIVEQLKRHEGFRSKPYKCTEGYFTIGIGRNLETNGISEEEAEYLLKNDISRCEKSLEDNLCFFKNLDQPRKEALINMCFQLGVGGILKFKKMLAAINDRDFERASVEALDSRWAKQTPERAAEIAEQLKTGQYKEI